MDQRPTVRIAQGEISGTKEDGVYRFLGVPYAEATTGENRWCAPVPAKPWQGQKDASNFGPIAPQIVGAGFTLRETRQSEDCLNLNVWTSSLDQNAQMPVMVWIHGGGNLGGAGSEDAFDGSRLAETGVVVVTFNYRLGAFGYLAHPLFGANFAVLDQVAALRWVRENIKNMGGNPERVTIFGESAGAVAVRTLLSTPSALGLFQAAIIQSAGFERFAFAPGWSLQRATEAADKMFDALGTRDPQTLRALPTEKLLAASHQHSGIFPPAGQVHTPANLVWMPVPDDRVVAKEGFPGWAENVPVMFGCLENEARYFIKPGGDYSLEVVTRMARALAGPGADELVGYLQQKYDDPYAMLDRLYSTAIWFEPAFETAKRFAADGRNFFVYHFARCSPGAKASGDLVRHSAEIRYVFGNLDGDCYDEVDRDVSDWMQMAWTSFAREGVPGTEKTGKWPAYNADDPELTWIQEDIRTVPYRADPVIQIFNAVRHSGRSEIA